MSGSIWITKRHYISIASLHRRRNPYGKLWLNCLESTTKALLTFRLQSRPHRKGFNAWSTVWDYKSTIFKPLSRRSLIFLQPYMTDTLAPSWCPEMAHGWALSSTSFCTGWGSQQFLYPRSDLTETAIPMEYSHLSCLTEKFEVIRRSLAHASYTQKDPAWDILQLLSRNPGAANVNSGRIWTEQYKGNTVSALGCNSRALESSYTHEVIAGEQLMNRIYVGTCVGQTLSATMAELFVGKKTCKVVTDTTTDVGTCLIFNGGLISQNEAHSLRMLIRTDAGKNY